MTLFKYPVISRFTMPGYGEDNLSEIRVYYLYYIRHEAVRVAWWGGED